jgi:CheY-like chemotaxis protein
MPATPRMCQIVLAEDNPADTFLVRRALHEHRIDCDLLVISDGEQLLKLIDRFDANANLACPDLLLLDLSLPKHGGLDVLKHLRKSERCGQTPVVILTSSDWIGDREEADRNAAVHFFRKPSSLDQFMLIGLIVKGIIGETDHPV